MSLREGGSGAEFDVTATRRADGSSVTSRVQAVAVVDPRTGAASAGGLISTAVFTPAAAAYSAGDIMQGAVQFQSIGPANGGHIVITNTRLRVDANAVQSGETSYRLQLYTVTPPSALADNAVWDLAAGDRTSYVGFIDLGTPVDVGSTLWVEQTGLTKQINVPSGGALWGYLVTNGGFTATAAARNVTLLSAVL